MGTPMPELGASHQRVLLSAAAETTDRLPELTDRVANLVIAHEPAYTEVSIDDLRRSLSANFGEALLAVAGTSEARYDAPAAPKMTGRRRAQQGVPLESMLHAYHLGGQALTKCMLAVAQRRSPREPIASLGVATAVMAVTDNYFQAALEAYQQNAADLQRYDSPRPQAMFDALLDGHGADPSVVAEAASVLALPATGRYVVVVCALEPSVDHRSSPVHDVCAVHGFPAAWRQRADRDIGIVSLGGAALTRLVDMLRREASGRVGVSSMFNSLGDVPSAHRLAELAIRTLRSHRPEVAWLEERLPEALIVASPDLSGRLAKCILGQVLELPQPERDSLLETLVVWYDSNSAHSAASALSCHRNTVLKRLRRVETLTGRSLVDHRDLLACYLALLALRLLPSGDPATGLPAAP
jgi:PucR C-terminal helix-turn-helix domain/GGDEF-like domain